MVKGRVEVVILDIIPINQNVNSKKNLEPLSCDDAPHDSGSTAPTP